MYSVNPSRTRSSRRTNVRGSRVRLRAARRRAAATRRKLDLPDNAAIGILSVERPQRRRLSVTSTGFLTPSTIVLVDAASASVATVKDHAGALRRFERRGGQTGSSRRSDGTKIPYLWCGPKRLQVRRIKPDGPQRLRRLKSGPRRTIGSCSANCGSSAAASSCWRTSAAAGSSDPTWHEAALKTHRQVAFDDFAAVDARI